MSDLRAKLIAALKPYVEVDPTIEPNEWTLAQRYNAGLALDAFLDCLAENPDEWAEETRVPTLVGGDALALIVVLSEDR